MNLWVVREDVSYKQMQVPVYKIKDLKNTSKYFLQDRCKVLSKVVDFSVSLKHLCLLMYIDMGLYH